VFCGEFPGEPEMFIGVISGYGGDPGTPGCAALGIA